MKKWVFRISIVMNIIFMFIFAWNWMHRPLNELGRLEKDIEVGYFQSDAPIFRIPKGLTVKNVSKRGSTSDGKFENERFSIVITSNDPNLVTYDLPKDSLNRFDNFYSAEIPQTNAQQGIPQGNFIYDLYFVEYDGRTDNSECKVKIDGNKIIIEQTENTNLKGEKEVYNGLIIKHKSGKWILTNNAKDANAEEIGGCTGIPIIKFDKKIIEWC